jgi:predicted dinucleotide-binding enzyme
MVEKVAMIGDGNVGTALTQGLTRAGYEVRAVGKEPQRVKELAGWGDVVVLAVPYGERQNALREMGDAIRGKVLVDVTNALGTGGAYAGSVQKSGAEEVQDMARAAKVVKAFNTVFAQSMSDGRVHGERISTFVAGDDAQAKQKVLQLARDIGFDAVDAGNLENARWIEPMGMLNIKLGYQVGMGPGIGIKLVHEANRAGGAPPPSQPQRTARTT